MFLIAGYSAQNTVDASLVYMVRALSELGDIVLFMDSDVPKSELEKLSKYVIYAAAKRHSEYDFGSYKRAYIYAKKSDILKNYDFVYLINDSVYGPLFSIEDTLKTIESYGTDAFGLACNPHKDHPHIQSWFIGMRSSVFMTDWFDEFMNSITRQSNKGAVTHLYEQGFTKLLNQHNKTWRCKYSVSGRGVYNKIKRLYRAGMPFVKKAAFTRHNGELGGQILYVLRHINPDVRGAILSGAKATFGTTYIEWLLTENPLKIMTRKTKYFLHKLYVGGI